MFSKDLELTIGNCYKRTREARYEFMTVEHLLLALLDNVSAESVLRAVHADIPRLRDEPVSYTHLDVYKRQHLRQGL